MFVFIRGKIGKYHRREDPIPLHMLNGKYTLKDTLRYSYIHIHNPSGESSLFVPASD